MLYSVCRGFRISWELFVSALRAFGWFRVIPLCLVLLFGLISFGYTSAPSLLLRPFYPLEYQDYISKASARYSVDPYLVAAVIECESNWNSEAESYRGAQGLMQLMPDTASDMVRLGLVDGSEYDPEDLSDAETNIMFGCAYLRYLIDYFNGSIDYAIAAYNAGLSNVEEWASAATALHNAITFPETQAYLIRVKNAHKRYQELYAGTFEGM